MNGEKYLNEFYLKTILIKGAANTVNINWGTDTVVSVDRHIFTDPFNVDITSDPIKVAYFNNIFNTNDDVIRWRKVIDSKQEVTIKKDNKLEIVSGFINQNYTMLSVSLFENLITLIKNLLILSYGEDVFKGYNKNSAKSIINLFKDKYSRNIEIIDKKTIYDFNFISSLHNLRMFRNCITHNNSELKDIESEFIKDKDTLNLKRNLLNYKESNGRLYLDFKSFKNLLDLYSQFAYIAYKCQSD